MQQRIKIAGLCVSGLVWLGAGQLRIICGGGKRPPAMFAALRVLDAQSDEGGWGVDVKKKEEEKS